METGQCLTCYISSNYREGARNGENTYRYKYQENRSTNKVNPI